jgi:hypothetical protein
MSATKKEKSMEEYDKKVVQFEKDLAHYNSVKLELEVLGSTRGVQYYFINLSNNTF